MTWAGFYLICFAAGFAFSFLSFLMGGTRGRLHLPPFPHGHATLSHPPVGHAPAASGAPRAGGAKAQSTTGQVSPLNFVTFTAFLAWFGGAGYLLTRYSTVWIVLGLGLAVLSGLFGAAVVFLFLSRVLTSPEENLDPADYEMVGVLGRISVPIREGGTGELIYSQAGTRRSTGARAEDGTAIDKGSEVVVTHYEKGIAYVRLWDDIAGES